MNNNALINCEGKTEKQFLEEYNEDEYKKPSVTTDILIFTATDVLKILLIKRKDHPFINHWAIPGGFVNIDENLYNGAKRELLEETNLKDIYMEQLYTWGDVNRDPRMRVISTSYMALCNGANLVPKAGDDAKEAKWFSIKRELLEESNANNEVIQKFKLTLTSEDEKDVIVAITKVSWTPFSEKNIEILDSNKIAFDHIKIIQYALNRLASKVYSTNIVFNLMPKYFTMSQLQVVYETILGKKIVSSNFRRKMKNLNIVKESKYTTKTVVRHRPAKFYEYNLDWREN